MRSEMHYYIYYRVNIEDWLRFNAPQAYILLFNYIHFCNIIINTMFLLKRVKRIENLKSRFEI